MKIGELASATATKVETVRYYEKIGLLPPPARTSANYRADRAEHLARISFIRRARDLSFKLEILRESSSARSTTKIGSCRHDRVADCKIIETLAPRRITPV